MRSKGYDTWCVCVSVGTFSHTMCNKAAKKRYQQVQYHTSLFSNKRYAWNHLVQKLWHEKQRNNQYAHEYCFTLTGLCHCAHSESIRRYSKVKLWVKGCIQTLPTNTAIQEMIASECAWLWTIRMRLCRRMHVYSNCGIVHKLHCVTHAVPHVMIMLYTCKFQVLCTLWLYQHVAESYSDIISIVFYFCYTTSHYSIPLLGFST